MSDSTRRAFLWEAGAFLAVQPFKLVGRAMAEMIEPISTSEKLMYVTTRIVGLSAAGAPVTTGTGFFYTFPHAAANGRVLITNKHVIAGSAITQFVVHAAPKQDVQPPKPTELLTVRAKFSDWVPHPNSNIDLCGLAFGDPANPSNLMPFTSAVTPDILPTPQLLEILGAVEDILMIGYPNGLWDAKNNYPLLRRGITASHPALDFDVDGVATTVIDVAAFPGSSGSPIFIYNNGTVPDKKGNIAIGSRIMFLGVLYKGPIMQSDGRIVVRDIPTAMTPVAQITQMMNLATPLNQKKLSPSSAPYSIM
jgi:hypothetical protein